MTDIELRTAQINDLEPLLRLYTQLHENPVPAVTNELKDLWNTILNNSFHYILLGCYESKIVSSCALTIVPNLTHSQRPYGIVENVVTDQNSRNKGYGTRLLDYAKKIATDKNCYKIMLMTGSKEESTLKFYEKSGYNAHDKTAFIQWL